MTCTYFYLERNKIIWHRTRVKLFCDSDHVSRFLRYSGIVNSTFLRCNSSTRVPQRNRSVGIIGNNANRNKRITPIPAEVSADCKDVKWRSIAEISDRNFLPVGLFFVVGFTFINLSGRFYMGWVIIRVAWRRENYAIIGTWFRFWLTIRSSCQSIVGIFQSERQSLVGLGYNVTNCGMPPFYSSEEWLWLQWKR